MEQRALTKSEKISLTTTEIAKRVRQQLKEEFPGYKFSVVSEYYSMGSSITVALMKSKIKVIKDFEDISEAAIHDYGNRQYGKEALMERQKSTHHQLNAYSIREAYDTDHWCNGVFLTRLGFDLLKRVVEIVDYYNFNDSDSQTDYYSVNFSFSINLGKWNKPFIDGGGTDA